MSTRKYRNGDRVSREMYTGRVEYGMVVKDEDKYGCVLFSADADDVGTPTLYCCARGLTLIRRAGDVPRRMRDAEYESLRHRLRNLTEQYHICLLYTSPSPRD